MDSEGNAQRRIVLRRRCPTERWAASHAANERNTKRPCRPTVPILAVRFGAWEVETANGRMMIDYKDKLLEQFRARDLRTKGKCLTFQALTFALHRMPGYEGAACDTAVGRLGCRRNVGSQGDAVLFGAGSLVSGAGTQLCRWIRVSVRASPVRGDSLGVVMMCEISGQLRRGRIVRPSDA